MSSSCSQNPIEQNCPRCGYVLDAQTCLTDKPDVKPSPGDLTICFGCAGFLKYDQGLKLLLLDPGEFASLPFDVQETLTKARYLILVKKVAKT